MNYQPRWTLLKSSFFQILVLTTSFVFLGCVTVKVGDGPGKKASNVKYTEPSAPFEQADSDDADVLWHNPSSAVSISYLSRCNETADPSLDGIQSQMLGGIENSGAEKQERYTYNGREALDSIVEGKIDGVSVRLRLITFKKNKCHYTLSYVGRPKAYAKDSAEFERFVRSFEVP